MGPGIITAFADNDAGGIATYAQAGALYGYRFLWLVALLFFNLAVVQEMVARMGAVTQKGLAELIREEYGVRWTLFALGVMFIANLGTTAAEFAGIGASMELLGVSKFVSIPLVALAVWLVVVYGNFRSVEKVFLGLTLIFGAYVLAGIKAGPDWSEALRNTFIPSFTLEASFILLFIAVMGTTITPWMQFFLQSTVADKGIPIEEYRYSKLDVYIGSFFTEFVAFFIVVATATVIYYQPGGPHPTAIRDAADAARALEPVAGRFAELLFAIGLFGASLLASAVLPLATAYPICEAFGWELGLSKTWRQAPVFYGIFTVAILVGAAIILFLPTRYFVAIMLISQDINGILLPVVLVFMLKLINNKRIMGEHTNSPVFNVIAWATTVVLIILTIALVVTSLIPGLS